MKSLYYIHLIAIAALIYSCADNKNQAAAAVAPVAVPVYNVAVQNAYTWQEYPVTLEGRTDVEIRPQVDGYLQKTFVDEGAYVTAGQPIFKIEDHRYREAYNNARGVLNATEAALINAQLEVERVTPLVNEKVVSDYQLKSAKASLKIAEANKRQAEAAVATAKINLDYTLITAPVSGYITRLPKKQGSLVSAADVQPLTSLSDNAQVHAYFSVSEADFMVFRTKNEGNTLAEKISKLPALSLIMPDNSEYAQKGKVDMVNGQFDRTTGAITLRASFPNEKGLLRSGNTGKVRLGFPHENALLVPQSATVELQDKVFVYVVSADNKVTKTQIGIAGKSDNEYLVTTGVKAGDRIVYKGFESLQDGTVIAPEKINPELAAK